MSINTFIPAFAGEKSSIEKVRYSTATPLISQKDRILTCITDGVHLITLLGMACKLIGELTDDPAFYEQARRLAKKHPLQSNNTLRSDLMTKKERAPHNKPALFSL